MYTVTKEFKWDSSHRLMGHKGKCHNIHGHTYKAAVTLMANQLDELNMVLDFYNFKSIQEWIDESWDHSIMLHSEDVALVKFIKEQGFKHFLCDKANPTAEEMAAMLFGVAEEKMRNKDVRVVSVSVWETPTSFATYTKDADMRQE